MGDCMDIKYQIFISSTYTDLKEARERITKAILSSYHIPIGMEMFNAGDEEQWEVIKKTIDVSDYYVLIIGHRYGSLTDEGISYTEKEYRYAKEKGIPIHVFIRKDDVATKPDEREENTDSILKLKAFREEAKTGRIVDFWEHISELENKVLLSLFKAINSKKGIGWIRADKVDVAAMSDELVRLSKENHDLRNEVKRLESMIKARNPKIDVKINDGNDLKLEIIRRNDYKLYEPVKYEDLPEEVSNYMQPDVINEYNTQLSKIHELNNYNDAISSIKYIKDNQIKPTITVTNTGTGKANDIDITIEFPDEVVVMKDKKLNLDLDKVEKPEGLPKHPYDLAKERRQEEMLKQHPELKAAINISKMANAFRINDSFRSAVNLSSIADSVGKFSIHQSLSVLEKENKIDISINDLLHTNEITFDDEDFIIIPKKSGCYEIKVSIICEEYETRDEFLIPVTIEETVKYFDVENYL
ncbi:hypothetical protein C1I36_12420 [Dehalobacter sp. 14DCB1]|jgi:hypothetical protein|nr:hypothetical protein C1I36_12420 [Dehalobacter sp. 14DCB1]